MTRDQLRERCNATCKATTLPLSVDGLADLCARNPSIPKVYGRCAEAGFAKRAEADNPLPATQPRPKCHSVGANVEFVASKEEGGTITCEGDLLEPRPARLPAASTRARPGPRVHKTERRGAEPERRGHETLTLSLTDRRTD